MPDAPLRVARTIDEVPPGSSVATIGVFDGVHRGHQTLIGRAVRAAEERDVRAVAITFDRHPSEVVRPGSQPRYLQTLERKIVSLLSYGVDLVLVLPFTLELSRLDPVDFVDRVLAGPVGAVEVVVGANFRFGHTAAGDVSVLEELGVVRGFAVDAVDLLDVDTEPISSTAIREHLDAGDVRWAAGALGRPYVLEGAVVKGEGRGRSIGIATANLEVDPRLQVPANGVYAGHAVVLGGDGRLVPAVTNVGTRPTFGGEGVTVEAHLLDADLDLYGDHLAVSFEHRLRDEIRFSGPDELVAQIHRDIADARTLLDA